VIGRGLALTRTYETSNAQTIARMRIKEAEETYKDRQDEQDFIQGEIDGG